MALRSLIIDPYPVALRNIVCFIVNGAPPQFSFLRYTLELRESNT